MKKLNELGISTAPWGICDWCAGHLCIASKGGWRVCETRESADARLIAAAPEMYDVLLDAVGTCSTCKKDCSDCLNSNAHWMPKARAAIAKAAGESDAINGE